VVDVNDTLTRIYVYDSNRPQFHSPATALAQLEVANESRNYPPYIEINRTGEFWRWSFEMSDGDMWGGTHMIGFTPHRKANGRRTLPTDWEGSLLTLLRGSADGHVEDRDGRVVDIDRDGEWVSEIPGGMPIPHVGRGKLPVGYILPPGDYTTHVEGTGDGTYGWAAIFDGKTAFSIDDADIDAGSVDTIDMQFDDDDPLGGRLTYSTTDEEKGYSATIQRKFEGARTRTYRVLNCTLHDDGKAIINNTPDCNGLVFENRGPHSMTFDVAFGTNVVSEALWNSTGRPAIPPVATRQGISVQPWETVVVYPEDWLNLTSSRILIAGEDVPLPGTPSEPVSFTATYYPGAITLNWDPPQDDGGSPVTGYVLWRGMDGAEMSEHKQLGVQTSYEDAEVEPGHTYYFSLRAVNAIGEGLESKSGEVQVPKKVNGDGDDDGIPLVPALIIILIVFLGFVVLFLTTRRKTH
jgi:hypothetical protein